MAIKPFGLVLRGDPRFRFIRLAVDDRGEIGANRIRNPAALHWLWILVLLKLLTPPIWSPQWALLPAYEPAAEFSADATISGQSNPHAAFPPQLSRKVETQSFSPVQPDGFLDHPAPDLASESDARPDAWRRVGTTSVSPLLFVAVVWGGGTLLWWGLSMWRIIRLHCCLRFAREAPPEIQQTTSLTMGRPLEHRK